MSIERLIEKAGTTCRRTRSLWCRTPMIFPPKPMKGKLRLSGEPYIEHPLQVALTLAELQLDAELSGGRFAA